MPPTTALTLTPEEADLSVAAIDAFTVALGGRQGVLEALQVANGTPEVDQITKLLIDPVYAGWPLRKLCTLAGLTVADLFTAYKKAALVKAHLQATKVVTDHLVQVVEDVMRRSQPHQIPCERCGGRGTVLPHGARALAIPIPCDGCYGSGSVLQQPDLDRQKLALELGQLVTKSNGINLTQQTLVASTGNGFGPGAIDQLQQAVAEILTPRRRVAPVVEATLVQDGVGPDA